MKNKQNQSHYYELYAGLGTLLATLMYIYLIDIPLAQRVAELHKKTNGYNWSGAFIFLLLPAALVVICSYFHAFKNSKIAFGFLFLIGSFVALTYAVPFLVGVTFDGYVLIGILPALFAMTTKILAVYNLFCKSLLENDFT